MMSPLLPPVLAWVAGLGLGLFYFGGLWLTIDRLPTLRRPAPVLIGSFVGRTAVALLGFYFVMGGRWERLLACLLGFVVARRMVIARLRPDRPTVAPRGNREV